MKNVLPFLLKKLNVNVSLVHQILDSTFAKVFPKVSGADVMLSRTANATLNEAEIIAQKNERRIRFRRTFNLSHFCLQK